MTLTLFAEPCWADAYTAGQSIHDGIRECVVLAVHDCNGGMSGRCVTVEYPDGHRTTFGYDHTFLPGGEDTGGGGSSHTTTHQPVAATRSQANESPAAVATAPGS